jgi:hypothetical protein
LGKSFLETLQLEFLVNMGDGWREIRCLATAAGTAVACFFLLIGGSVLRMMLFFDPG